MGTNNKYSLKQFKKNVVMKTYEFVVDGYCGREDDEAWELIFVDAESLEVAKIKAKETAVAYGYKNDPDFVGVIKVATSEVKGNKIHIEETLVGGENNVGCEIT